jgi:hypothetical protein
VALADKVVVEETVALVVMASNRTFPLPPMCNR